MTGAVTTAAEAPPALTLHALGERGGGVIKKWLAPVISLAILAAAVAQLRGLDWRETVRLMPDSAHFWVVFAASYLFGPASEWVIFRRLWRLPMSGFVALLRKRLSNEILLGYSGEAYFYGWARRHVAMATAPFAAVKDVAILSAAVANVATLALVAACWPFLPRLHLGTQAGWVAGSALIVTLGSLVPMLFRRWLFGLPRADLLFIAGVHLVRVVATTLLTAWLWALMLPQVSPVWWLLLATLRMLVSRLPLLPNKELVFAGLATFLVGRSGALTDVVSMVAALWLATHLVLGAALGVIDLARFDFAGRRGSEPRGEAEPHGARA